jgi:hypothetical protein
MWYSSLQSAFNGGDYVALRPAMAGGTSLPDS